MDLTSLLGGGGGGGGKGNSAAASSIGNNAGINMGNGDTVKWVLGGAVAVVALLIFGGLFIFSGRK